MVGELIAGRYELEEPRRARRDVERLPRVRPDARAHRRAEGAAPAVPRRPRVRRALPPRGARGRAALASDTSSPSSTAASRDGRQFIVFEFVDGENLKQLLERTGPLPVRRAVELGDPDRATRSHSRTRTASSTATSSRRTSSSTRTATVKVTDFGIARTLDVERGVTQTGHRARDEQLPLARAGGGRARRRRRATSTRSASSSTSCSPASVPFRGRQPRRGGDAARDRAPAEPRRAAPGRARRGSPAVEHALEKKPELRFPAMDAFAAELRRCLDELGGFDADRTIVRGVPAVNAAPPERRVQTRSRRLPLAVRAGRRRPARRRRRDLPLRRLEDRAPPPRRRPQPRRSGSRRSATTTPRGRPTRTRTPLRRRRTATRRRSGTRDVLLAGSSAG